jgi:protein involved in polysaccharide export with SLBB domain
MVAQDLMKLQDLSKYKVEVLTDADVLRIRQQLMANKLEIDQVRPLLLNRGLTPAQFEVLKARIEGTYTNKNLVNGKYKFDANKDALRKKQNQGLVLSKEESLLQTAEQKTLDSLQLLTEEKPLKPVIDPRIFGSELFNKTSYDQLGFESDLTNLATPVNYEIGPGDQLKLVVFGKQELDADVTVTREGNINIPNVGLVKLAGLTIESAQTRLKKTMQRMYPTLNGGSNLLLTVADIRTIRVTVIGANKPGAFNIPSLAGVYYALTMAGGPISMGSFRTIELVRDNKLYKTIDLYRLLSKGDQIMISLEFQVWALELK